MAIRPDGGMEDPESRIGFCHHMAHAHCTSCQFRAQLTEPRDYRPNSVPVVQLQLVMATNINIDAQTLSSVVAGVVSQVLQTRPSPQPLQSSTPSASITATQTGSG